MEDHLKSDEYEFHIDPFGRNAGMWNLYTQLTFCYSTDHSFEQSHMSNVLAEGLQRLTESFPWVAGQVVRERPKGAGDYDYVIKPFESIPRFVVKDLSNSLPPREVYRRSGYSITLLDENAIAPRNTKSISDEDDPKPVFLLQASLITNGLLLTFLGQHGTFDIVGQAEMIRLLSKACHDEPFTNEELELGNRDRRTIVPLPSEHDEQHPQDNSTDSKTSLSPSPSSSSKTPPNPKPKEPTSTPAKNIWADFLFTTHSLQSLKTAAIKSTTTLTTPFISTDDALSAFIWQRISHVRLSRVPPTTTTTFARTVDLRRYLTIPPTYPGNLATKTYSTYPIHHLPSLPLGTISSQLRSTIDPKTSNLPHQALASLTPSSSSHTPTPHRDLSKDIALSSWVKVGTCYDLDFNLGLGKPEAVRRPGFAPPDEQPMEGLVYLLPREPDGGVVVVVCLREVDMERLKGDEEWGRYARSLG